MPYLSNVIITISNQIKRNGYTLSIVGVVMVKIGETAPAFTLKTTDKSDVSLSDYKGEKVILAFYPGAFTGVCDKEMFAFQDNIMKLNDAGIVVLGISKDSASSHQKFIEKYDLPFVLLTDPEPYVVSSAYDSYGLKKFMGKEYMGMMRNTFLIDADGKIEKIYLKVKAAIMADHIIEDLGLN